MLATTTAKTLRPALARNASTITSVRAREVLDSRGTPTVEVDLVTQDGLFRAIVPSGASTGTHEACELRDGGKRYGGKGVSKAVENVNNQIAKLVKGMDVREQQKLDDAMLKLDGTKNKTNLGANAILGVSMAAAHAGAAAKKMPLYQHFADLAGTKQSKFVLPTPCLNVINGGSHAGNKLAFQEFFMIPTGAKTFREAMQMGCEAYQTLKKVIKKRYGGDATLIGDEGGFAPPVDATQGIELLMEAIKEAGYEGKIVVGLDVAASEFKVKGQDSYDLDFKTPAGPKKDPKSIISSTALMQYYQDMCKKFPIVTIEDGFDEDDWGNWSKFVKSMDGKIQIVGDDLTCTNMSLIERAVKEKAANALLLKVNQIGSISESIGAVQLSKKNGWGVMTSHRSGETEDTTISDLAVGLCTGEIKAGAPARSERTAKYNRLIRIEEELGSKAVFAGAKFRTPEQLL